MSNFSRGRQVYRAVVSAHTTGAIVAAVTGKKITVLSMALTIDTLGDIVISSAAVALTGSMSLLAGTPLVVSSETGVLQTAASAALNLEATQAVNGFITYTLEA